MFHSPPSSSSSSSHICVEDSSLPMICPAPLPAIYAATAAHHGFLDANASAFSHPLSSSPSYSFSYSSSLPNSFLPRSSSAHSLPFYHRLSNPLARSSIFSPPQNSFLHLQQAQQQTPTPTQAFVSSSLPSSSSGEFLEFGAAPMRRVFSAGDLQGSYGTPATGENHNHNQEGGAVSSKVARYSSEERKERIERYRSKRNQRNFHKKITYACRKTLADSRPRVKGRFARNGEAETGAEVDAEAADNLHEFYALSSFEPARTAVGESADGNEYWLRHMQAALEEDEDIWATICDGLSMNLLS